MPFDSSLDECLFEKFYETDLDRLSVRVCSYNKGPKKLQISRESKGPQVDFRFAKLGRVTKEEVKALLPLIQEALKNME